MYQWLPDGQRQIPAVCTLDSSWLLQGGSKKLYLFERWLPVEKRVICQVSECCRQKAPNLHTKSVKYSLVNLPKSSLLLKLSICLHSMCPSSLNSKTHCQKVQIKFCELFSVRALQQIAWSQNFSNWPAKMCANWMLGSADPEHTDSSNQSAA